jgi:outer membrane protein assembly factor BamA
MSYVRDHTNEPVIPTNGYYLQSKFFWYDMSPGATEKFPSLDLYAAFFRPIFLKDSVFLIARGGSTFGSNGTGTPQFFLGGPGRLSAYGLNELFGNHISSGASAIFTRSSRCPPSWENRYTSTPPAKLAKCMTIPLRRASRVTVLWDFSPRPRLALS